MIRLSFFGDFVCKDPSQLSLDTGFSQLISESDILALNFEAPVKCSGKPITKSGPSIYQSKDSPAYLEDIGFNVIQLANNHIMDYGEEGVKQTIQSFKKAHVIGAGEKEKAYSSAIIDVKGVKVGLLSLVQKEFGALDDFSIGDDIGTAWINYHRVDEIICETRQLCDVLVVLPHAGIENVDIPLPEWRLRYKHFIDMGADAVVASHPHVPQGWEIYKDKYIFYSLGNFFFFKPGFEHASKANEGLAVSLCITEDKHITAQVFHTQFTDTAIRQYTDIERDKYLCSLLLDKSKYQECLNIVMDGLWNDYQLYMLRGLGSMSLKTSWNTFIHSAYGMLKGMDVPMLLNNFQCESHRWAIERILRNKMN